MSTSTKLLRVSDDLGSARILIEAAFMATHALAPSEGGPIAATLMEAQRHMRKAERRLKAMRQHRAAKASATATEGKANG